MSFHTTTSTLILLASLALAACDKTPTTTAPAPVASAAPSAGDVPPVVPVRVAPVPPEHLAGKKAFDQTCGLCHGAGTGGAPRPGDKANWAPRIAQGRETLYQHALLGFNGVAGFMPARGGAALSDDEVKAGVDYMVFLSQ
jgi:cytochrome c5